MTANVHATGLVLEGTGLILRGPSGSGKSLLALDLLDAWEGRQRPALLVADDRVELEVNGDGIEMKAPGAIAGLIELRGHGIVRRPFLPVAPLHLVVDLVEQLERMPEETELNTKLLGIGLPRCPVPRVGVIGSRHQILLIQEAIRSLWAA